MLRLVSIITYNKNVSFSNRNTINMNGIVTCAPLKCLLIYFHSFYFILIEWLTPIRVLIFTTPKCVLRRKLFQSKFMLDLHKNCIEDSLTFLFSSWILFKLVKGKLYVDQVHLLTNICV